MQHGRRGQILLGCRYHSGLGLIHVHTLSHDAGNVLPGLAPATGALAADAAKPEAATEAPSAEAPRPPLLERSQEDAQALERLVPKAEQQTLQAGADSFLALWKPANVADPQGAVIIVPGAGENADWPNAVGPLRRKFPDIGWHSLSVSLPDLLADAPQARVEAKPAPVPEQKTGESAPAKDTPADANANVAQATAADADTAESTDAVQASEQNDVADAERIFARLDAAVAFAQQQFAQHRADRPRQRRLLGSALPEREATAAGAETGDGGGTDTGAGRARSGKPDANPQGADGRPLLRHPNRRPQCGRAALAGQQAAKDSQYKQLSLIAMPANKDGEQEQLFRRVRGWMSPQQ